jgi:hypothetical protein
MDWVVIGAVGEMLGAVAVVISLAYVARQVRDSFDAAHRAHYLELNRETIIVAGGIARHDEWSDTVFRGFVGRSSLSPEEILRSNAGVLGVFRSWEAVFRSSREASVLAWGPRAFARGWSTSSDIAASKTGGER